jgi:hypothetical protein
MRLPLLSVSALLVALVPVVTAGCKKDGGESAEGGTGGATSAAAGSGASLAFLSGFEGEIDAFIKDSSKPNPQPVPVAVFVKSGKMKAAIPEGLMKHAGGANPLGDEGYVIFDSSAKKLTAVSDAKKTAIVIDLNTSGTAMSRMSPPGGGAHGAPSGTPPKITKTGKTDTVAGYPCEYWDITSDHKEGTVCVGKDGPSWFSIPSTSLPTEHAWALELMDGKHFPLRFIAYGKDGATEENRVEVTKIDKKSLADTEFQIPAGYKTIDLEKMFGGMPGGMPPGMPAGMPGMPGGGSFPVPPHH